MTMPRVLVVGGSLGGLFAANMLRAIGCEVRVFERAEQDLAGRGAGIGTHEELHRAMRELGLAFDESLGVRVQSRVCLERDGRISDSTARSRTCCRASATSPAGRSSGSSSAAPR